MEDTHTIRWFSDTNIGVMGVFDGHGGDWTSKAAVKLVPETLNAHLKALGAEERGNPAVVIATIRNAFAAPDVRDNRGKAEGNTERALKKDGVTPKTGARPGLSTVDEKLFALRRKYKPKDDSGAVTAVAVHVDDAIYIAHLGDCRALLVHDDGSTTRLSTDHRMIAAKDGQHVTSDSEKEKVTKRGGEVFFWGGMRVNGLEPTRVLGDFSNQRGEPYGRRPEVVRIDATQQGATLLLACDGVFERLHDTAVGQYVADSLAASSPTERVAGDVIRASAGRGSTDNQTVLLTRLGKADT